ncbi:Ycf66 family protein [Leptolyngbyaceae cyanobacterium UHCC 1019]
MVNIGLNLGSILGLLQILIALGYLAVSIAQIASAIGSQRNTDILLRVLQLIFAPIILFLCGAILFLQGWRLDPILQFQQLLLSFLISYLILLDLGRSNRNSQR